MTTDRRLKYKNRCNQQHGNTERCFYHDGTRKSAFQFAMLLSLGYALCFRQARSLLAEMKVVYAAENQHEHHQQKLEQQRSSICGGPKCPKTIDMNPSVV